MKKVTLVPCAGSKPKSLAFLAKVGDACLQVQTSLGDVGRWVQHFRAFLEPTDKPQAIMVTVRAVLAPVLSIDISSAELEAEKKSAGEEVQVGEWDMIDLEYVPVEDIAKHIKMELKQALRSRLDDVDLRSRRVREAIAV